MSQHRWQEGSGIIGLDRGRVQKRWLQAHFKPVGRRDAWCVVRHYDLFTVHR